MRRHSTPDLLPWQTFSDMGVDCVSVCQDGEGYLWCGSATGLCRFDGKWHRYFTPAEGLPRGQIANLLADDSNRIWIGTRPTHDQAPSNALAVLDGDRIRIFDAADGWPGWRVTGMAPKRNGAWIGAEGGIALVEGDRFRTYTRADGLISEHVNCLIARHDESVWAGTDFGLVAIDRGRIRHMTTADGLPSKPVTALAEDHDGKLWIGLANGLACHDGKSFRLWTVRDGLTTVPVHTLCVDSAGLIWTGSYAGQGACVFDGESFVPITTASGMPHNSVSDIMADREGGVIFACNHGGVARLDLTGPARISDDPVAEAACLSKDGTFWWATGRQVVRYDGSEPQNVCRAAEQVTVLRADTRDRLWIGTISSLSLADTVSPVAKPRTVTMESDGPTQIRSVCEDASGTIWISTRLCGAFIYDDSEDRVFGVPSVLSTAPVSKIMIDSRGRMWAFDWASRADGIWMQDGSHRTRYASHDGLQEPRAACMAEDRAGLIWVGTLDGLASFDGHRFTTFTPDVGLAGRAVQCIVQDSRGHLWIGFLGGGISRFDGRNFQVLSTQDGLPSDRVTGIFEDRDGSMLITTYKGVCRYTPDSTTPPHIRIDAVETDRPHSPRGTIRMPDSVPVLRIRFHGISLKTRRMRYTYILDGHDRDWRATWADEVRYEGLPPGTFTFRVVAVNRDLVYSEAPAEVRIEVVRDPREQRMHELEQEVRTLEGLLPICSVCKRIRNDRNEWEQLEVYVSRRSRADFSHGYCPHCAAQAVREIQGNQSDT